MNKEDMMKVDFISYFAGTWWLGYTTVHGESYKCPLDLVTDTTIKGLM